MLAPPVVPDPIVGTDYPIAEVDYPAVAEVVVVVRPTTKIVGGIVETPMDCLVVGEVLELEFPTVSLVVDTPPIEEEDMLLTSIHRGDIRVLREGDFVLLQEG